MSRTCSAVIMSCPLAALFPFIARSWHQKLRPFGQSLLPEWRDITVSRREPSSVHEFHDPEGRATQRPMPSRRLRSRMRAMLNQANKRMTAWLSAASES
jgi:hypothetical protein